MGKWLHRHNKDIDTHTRRCVFLKKIIMEDDCTNNNALIIIKKKKKKKKKLKWEIFTLSVK